MDNRRLKFCLKILSRFEKIIRKPQGVEFFGAPCIADPPVHNLTVCYGG